jgi:hypothetical protein
MTVNKLKEATAYTIKRRENDALVRKHLPQIKTFFRAQRDLYLDRLANYQNLFPESNRVDRSADYYFKLIEQDRQMTLRDFDQIWSAVDKETFGDLQDVVTGYEEAGYKSGIKTGGDLYEGPKVNFAFDLDNPRAVNWFAQNGGSVDYIAGIQGTTADRLKTVITKGLEENKTYDQMARDIKATFNRFNGSKVGITNSRARTIAVNEIGNAYEAGNRGFIDELVSVGGVKMEKMWENSHDDDVTPECELNTEDGWIPLNQPHTSGHQQPMRFPRCRCFELYREAKI